MKKILSNFKPKDFAILFTVIVLSGLLIWRCFLPFIAELNYRDGFNLNSASQSERSLPYLEKAVKYAPYEVMYIIETAKAYQKVAEQKQRIEDKKIYLKKSEKAFLRALALDENNPWFYHRYAQIIPSLKKLFPENSNYTNLEQYLNERAAKIDDKNPLFHTNLAFYYHQHNALDAALKHYELALEMDSDMHAARFNKANILYQKGDLTNAINEYLYIDNVDPNFDNLSEALALIYYAKKDYVPAIQYLERAHAKSPTDKDIMKNLTTMYYVTSQNGKVVQNLDRLFKRYPKMQPQYYDIYVKAAINNNELKKAIQFVERFTILFPENETARNQLNQLKKYIN